MRLVICVFLCRDSDGRQIDEVFQKRNPEEATDDKQCTQLQTIPGVGPFTALLIKAEIGDVRRFEHSSQLISYVGLSPRTYQSGDSCHYGQLGQSVAALRYRPAGSKGGPQ